MISNKKNIKKQILLIGPTSEIAKEFLNKLKNNFSVITVARRKFEHNLVIKNIILKTDKNLSCKQLYKHFCNYKFSFIISFIADQNISDCPIYKLSKKKILNVLNTNAIFPIQLASFLIDKNQVTNNTKIIFFSSRSGSIFERGNRKHHLARGNHVYRASKSLLNSFIKDLAFKNSQGKKNKSIIVAYDPGWVKTKTSGGGNIGPDQAANNLIKLLNKSKRNINGKFINYNFSNIPW